MDLFIAMRGLRLSQYIQARHKHADWGRANMRGKSWRGRRSEKGWREVDGEEVERKVRWSF